MPRYFEKRKKGIYIILVIILITVLTIVQRYLCQNYFFPTLWVMNQGIFQLGFLVQAAALISLPILSSILAFISIKWYNQSIEAKEIIAQKKESELEYLKAQINPHFLFNSLNSLYGLSMEKSDKVPKLILKLSNLLSFSLYSSKSKKISISEEIDLINNFIDLENERYADRININFEVDPKLDLSTQIAPLFLIPLVENAFKHGIKESIEKVPIKISLKKIGQTINFEVENQISTSISNDNKTSSGLGLKNLRQRLKLIYPTGSKLDIKKTEKTFIATLKLPVNG